MNKQAVLLRESAEITDETTTTTVAPTPAPFTNAVIDAYGRRYSNNAFADMTSYYRVPANLPQYQDEQNF
uniref:Uncharacterized protein n=1 Tax=Panagrolaimus sp. JU765 TaxID=591449 RepID=A0AC34RH73_9BILA